MRIWVVGAIMISRELFTRLLSGMRAGEPATDHVKWLADVGAPPFTLKGKWATPANFPSREQWQVSLGCAPKAISPEPKKRPEYLRLVEPTAG
jgi:hypothetical protein